MHMPILTALGVLIVFTVIDQVMVPEDIGSFGALYNYCDGRGCVKDLAFERWM